MFGPVVPLLTERHQVIALDLQGRGRTAYIDRLIDVRLMAYDMADGPFRLMPRDLATQCTRCAQAVGPSTCSNHSANISRSTPRALYVAAARLSREMSLAPCCAAVIAIKAS